MPTNRRPLARRRNPQFTSEVLSLFVELEHGPKRSEKFRVRERELMYQLNLIHEWWTGDSVLDRSGACAYSPQYISYYHWHTCRRVRLQLLAASGGSAVRERRDRASRQLAPH
jgi:hypothetical protein